MFFTYGKILLSILYHWKEKKLVCTFVVWKNLISSIFTKHLYLYLYLYLHLVQIPYI